MEEMAFVLGLKERHRNFIGRENNMKKMVVGQEVMYTEDAAQVKLK